MRFSAHRVIIGIESNNNSLTFLKQIVLFRSVKIAKNYRTLESLKSQSRKFETLTHVLKVIRGQVARLFVWGRQAGSFDRKERKVGKFIST